MPNSHQQRPIALALAGGGPLGAMYEVGALVALADVLEGVDFNDFKMYIGVSAGSVISAALANDISPETICHMFLGDTTGEAVVKPEVFMTPAIAEFRKRLFSLPRLLTESVFDFMRNPFGRHFFASFYRLSKAIPTGVFSIDGLRSFIHRMLSVEGRTDDFRKLKNTLYIVATDLDSGDSVVFGSAKRDHVPISKAVAASAALPGLYPPVQIGGRYYVDGALKKTMHASIALKEGAKLVICINPLVPFDATLAARHGHHTDHPLVDEGLAVVLSQTFRAIIHSRMLSGLARYDIEYPDADVVLFEPSSDDADMFFTNIFSYTQRRRLVDHAYCKTREDLLNRYDTLAPMFARHGLKLNRRRLEDRQRTLDVVVPDLSPHRFRAGRTMADTVANLNDTLDRLNKSMHRIDLRPPTQRAPE